MGNSSWQETGMLIEKILPELSLEIIEHKRLQFASRCSKKKCGKTLFAPQNELRSFRSQGELLQCAHLLQEKEWPRWN
jgi:redox-regulated HSP33 family molecular chaperone